MPELDDFQLANLLVLHFDARYVWEHQICGRCQAIVGDLIPPLRWGGGPAVEIGRALVASEGRYRYLCQRCWWRIRPGRVPVAWCD
jgi:hypothetical protein